MSFLFPMKKVWWIRLVLPAKGNLLMDFLSLRWVLLAYNLVSHAWIPCKHSVCESPSQSFNVTFGLNSPSDFDFTIAINSIGQTHTLNFTASSSCPRLFCWPHAFKHSALCAALQLLSYRKSNMSSWQMALPANFSSHYSLAPFRSSCLISYLWGCLFFFWWSLMVFSHLFLSLVTVAHPLSCSLAVSLVPPSSPLIPSLHLISSPFRPQIGQIALKPFLVLSLFPSPVCLETECFPCFKEVRIQRGGDEPLHPSKAQTWPVLESWEYDRAKTTPLHSTPYRLVLKKSC